MHVALLELLVSSARGGVCECNSAPAVSQRYPIRHLLIAARPVRAIFTRDPDWWLHLCHWRCESRRTRLRIDWLAQFVWLIVWPTVSFCRRRRSVGVTRHWWPVLNRLFSVRCPRHWPPFKRELEDCGVWACFAADKRSNKSTGFDSWLPRKMVLLVNVCIHFDSNDGE